MLDDGQKINKDLLCAGINHGAFNYLIFKSILMPDKHGFLVPVAPIKTFCCSLTADSEVMLGYLWRKLLKGEMIW